MNAVRGRGFLVCGRQFDGIGLGYFEMELGLHSGVSTWRYQAYSKGIYL